MLHNITIEPGPVTLSDHIPVIVTLTRKALSKEIPPTLNMKNVDWEKFKKIIIIR